jgi:hypothetical protein
MVSSGNFVLPRLCCAFVFLLNRLGTYKGSGAYQNSQTADATAIQNPADAKTTTRMAVSIPYTVVFISATLSE